MKDWNDFIQRPEVRSRVIFLSDYDMLLAQELVQGMDLWINTPRRPWGAYGTSGMKVLAKGGLNLSEFDGWWVEAYSPEVGWAIGDGKEHGNDPAWDDAEAKAMYALLKNEVVPEFYERTQQGVPAKWLKRVRESMVRLTPEFSASRAIRDYTELRYLPAASSFRDRAADASALGLSLLQWQQGITRDWNSVRFGVLHTETRDGHHVFKVEMLPGSVLPAALSVDLYAEATAMNECSLQQMTGCAACDSPGVLVYSAKVPATRPTSDYTPASRPSIPARTFPWKIHTSFGEIRSALSRRVNAQAIPTR